ncbi:MAG: hypothetical protein EXQ97_07345 [Alphaproteobacteria bacterium]|nr:hypothetical protein [Alphaproteobacteria bacterium]
MLHKHESTDFFLVLDDKRRIGSEITQASDENSHKIHNREEHYADEFFFMTPPPSKEDSDVRWANLVRRIIHSKQTKILGKHWSDVYRNEIVFYPNFYHDEFVDYNKDIKHLAIAMRKFQPKDKKGHHVLFYILLGQRLIYNFFGASQSFPFNFGSDI